MFDGRIVQSGDKELALELEAKGYDWIKDELARSRARLISTRGTTMPTEAQPRNIDIDRTRRRFLATPRSTTFDAGTGLTHDTIDYIVGRERGAGLDSRIPPSRR